jgi:hypothetical protein
MSNSPPPTRFEPSTYAERFDFLHLAYRQGRLVPFIGSGLSAPALPGWSRLIADLAAWAEEPVRLSACPSEHELILASERVVSRVRGRGEDLAIGVERSLGIAQPTPATVALASTWWPLVMTTNYDRMFFEAFNNRHAPAGLGRAR